MSEFTTNSVSPMAIQATTREGDQPMVVSTHSNLVEAHTGRVYSIDVFRGIVMFLMLAELMHLHDLVEVFPGSRWAEWLHFHTTHVAWEGCSLHDLIQPGFTFLVGVSMAFSIASRIRRGGSRARMMGHAALRSMILVTLGIVLRSMDYEQTNFTFEDTLTQIGLGYFPVFCLAMWLPQKHYWTALAVVLIGFWAAYAVSPPAPQNFDYPAVGVPTDWPHHREGFASRFNKNSNLSWRFDVWFLNLFPRESTFEYNRGGYATLSFIPTMGTMLIGLIAGTWMRGLPTFRDRLSRLLVVGGVFIGVALLLTWSGVCPNVKRIWTPAFALYSGGFCLWALAGLHWICDGMGMQRWAFPFVVIGANSILIYVMSWTVADPLREMLLRHFGTRTFGLLGESLVPLTSGAATMAVMIAALWWLYRQRVFIRI